MKKIIIAAALAISFTAQADTSGLCASITSIAETVQVLRNLGDSWQEIETRLSKRIDPAEKIYYASHNILMNVARKTYYGWASLPVQTLQALAFSDCQAQHYSAGIR